MSETVKSPTELSQDIKDFRDSVRRKTGELEPGEHVRLIESSFINRRGFSFRYEADIAANTDTSYPPDLNLWHIVSPILYSKEEYTFHPETMLYMRSGVSAE